MIKLNVNTMAVVKFSKTLENLSRKALPNAVRNTLSKAALDVKQNTMPKQADHAFVKRQPNFFKANSRVEFAKGTDINKMSATVGFVETSLKGEHNYAVKDLEQQERGGTIKSKAFIAMRPARTGRGLVKANLRLGALGKGGKIINAARGKSDDHKQNYVRAAIMAKKKFGNNAFILGNVWGSGNQTLSKITRITRSKDHRKIKIHRTPLYTYRHGRKIQVARTNFMKRASHETAMRMDKIFVDEAVKQIKYYTTR